MRALIAVAAAGLAAVGLGCLAESPPNRNGNIFGLSAYSDGFYLGHS